MRKLILIFTALLYLPSFAGPANPPAEFAFGGMLGNIVSATGKYWFSKRSAIDFGIGFSGSPDAAIYGDYLFHVPQVFGKTTKFTRESALYFGGGVGIAFWEDSYDCGRWGCDRRRSRSGTGFFVRGLVGVEWYAAPTRFGVFGELGPTVLFSPTTATDVDVGVGGRFYF